MADERPIEERLAYWQLRALTEQQRRELADGKIAQLAHQLEAMRTQTRIEALMASMGMDPSMMWKPDDQQERFVRSDRPTAEPPAH